MPFLKDFTGARIGQLTVLSRAGKPENSKVAFWLCQCDCGNKIELPASVLTRGKRTTCGCDSVSLIKEGSVFGRLTVIRRHGSDKHRKITWLCQCSCGKNIVVSSNMLRRLNTRSCGCLRAQMTGQLSVLPQGKSGFNALVGAYKRGAKKRNLDFLLTEDQIREITQLPCFYCGEPPNHRYCINASEHSAYYGSGIDRQDPNVGYTTENCVPCCKQCNTAKMDYDVKDFLQWIDKAHAYQQRKNRGKKDS